MEAVASTRGRQLPEAVRKAVDGAEEARTHAPRAYGRLAAEAGRTVSAAVEDEIEYATCVGLAASAGGAAPGEAADCAWRLRWLQGKAEALGLPLTQARAEVWAGAVERLAR